MTLIPSLDFAGFAGTNQTLVQEQKYATTRRSQLNVRTIPIKKYMSTAKIFGVPPSTVSTNTNFWAAVGADPNNQFAWIVAYNSMDGSSTSVVFARVRIVYYVTFFNRQVPALS